MGKASTQDDTGISRREFLGGTAAAGAGALLGAPAAARAQTGSPGVAEPGAAQLARDTGAAMPPASMRAAQRPGSDLMVQVLRDLGVEFVASNPGSSFEGLQESIINYGSPPNVLPEFITALHEESAVDMAHGYAKATGKPMVALLHATVGLQHAAMAIYQAFLDRTPVVIIAGRDDGFIQAHTAEDMAGLVRPYTKWDAHPNTLPEALRAIQQAYSEAITPPCAPTLVILDTELQKQEAGDLQVPAWTPPRMPSIGDRDALRIAQGLVQARNPRLEVGRLRTPEGVARAIELAELVGACTGTQATRQPMSFPQRHALCGPGAGAQYDFSLGLEAAGADFAILSPTWRSLRGRDETGIAFGGGTERGRGAAPAPAGQVLTADAESSLPRIIEAARSLLDAGRRAAIEERKRRHAAANRQARTAALRAALENKRRGWEASPVSTARLYAELWPYIANEDWCLGSTTNFSGAHHADLWAHDKPYSFLGTSGGAGIGYSLGAATGAALAARGRGRIVINIQNDGDFNYTPGALWSAAHHRLPMLIVMHNNRAWHQETMFLQYMCGVRGRGTDRGHIGTTLRDPDIDYAKIAAGYGVPSEGPISDPGLLSAAYARGIHAVKQGQPYLIDVLTQPR